MDTHVEVAVRAFETAKTGLAREHWAVWRASSSGIVGDGATQYASTPVTTSLDAALALAERVLPGWPCWGVATDKPDRIGAVLASSDRDNGVMGHAPNPALCIAILRAKQGEGG